MFCCLCYFTGFRHVVTVDKRRGRGYQHDRKRSYRTKGFESKHVDSNLENLNISYVEQGRGVFILDSHLGALHTIF